MMLPQQLCSCPERKHRNWVLKPMGKIISWANGGLDPAYMGLGPIPAIKKALKKANLTIDQIDLIELNEAFSSQSLACIKELGVNTDKCNMFGGGISLGHPIGCYRRTACYNSPLPDAETEPEIWPCFHVYRRWHGTCRNSGKRGIRYGV